MDLDAALFNVESAMTTACTGVFALVGGGLVQDQLQFSGKEGSDFHLCELVDIPGFANSPEKGNSNGQVQPIPNPGGSQSNTWFRDFQELEPEAAASWMAIWGDLPSIQQVKDKYEVAITDVGGIDIVESQSYPAAGVNDWTPYVEQLIDSGATSFTWIGEPGFFSTFLTTARQRGFEGTALLETNMYDPALTGAAGHRGHPGANRLPPDGGSRPVAGDRGLPRHRESNVDDPKLGPLGMQSMSAWLLFATAANACGEANDGVLDRTCILEQAAATEDWTGGGLHAPQDPAAFDEAEASPCSMLVVVRDGEFQRRFPEVGGEGDDGDGFHCPDDGVSEVPGGGHAGVVDPDRPI